MNLSFLIPSLLICSCWAVQHPDGFTTVEKAQFLLQEPDSQQFILELEKGVVINEGGIVTREGKILKDTETYHEDQHRLLRGNRNIAEEDPYFFDGRLAIISSPGQENWYHWLFQVLPRLKVLKDSGVEYDKIYLDNLKFSWQRESLDIVMRLLDIPAEKLFLREGDAIVEAETLIVPSIPFNPAKNPAFPAWLKDFLLTSFLSENADSPERIYISRSKAKVRRIANEKALIALLEQSGFTVLHLEDLPVQQQAQLFHNAKVIIGPHGSGFANLIFSRPAAKVIEIDHGLAGDEQRSFYKRMAEIMACCYFGYYADTVDEEDLEKDIFIDLDDFNHFLLSAE